MKRCLTVIFNFLFFSSIAQHVNVPASIYDFKVTALHGSTIDFSQYKGKKILIVNTPEEADHSRQYNELDALYKQYKGKLVIIGFIANDFQIEPGSKKSPEREKHYDVTFPLASKVLVRGNLAPIYKWLTEKKYNNFKDSEVGWDFQKYLINENGQLTAIFAPKMKPADPALISAIDK